MSAYRKWTGPLLGFGLVLVFLGEHVIGSGVGKKGLALAAGMAVLAAVGGRIYIRGRAAGAVRRAESALVGGYAGVVLGLFLYALSTREAGRLLGDEVSKAIAPMLAVAWSSVLLVSGVTVLAMELAYRTMPLSDGVELRRIHNAAFDALSVAFALVFALSANYVATARDIRRDVTYLNATAASDSTLRMVRDIKEPIRVYLFFPPANEVLELVRPYFSKIDKSSDKVSLHVVDQAVALKLAREFNVERNGKVVVAQGEGKSRRSEAFDVGQDLEEARRRLKKLDGSFQEAFMGAARALRQVYFTVGHDERSASGGPDPGQSLHGLRSIFSRSNVDVSDLGMNEGLARAVPDGAPMVAIVGPRKPFLPEEVQSLIAYVRGGGRVLVMIDPGVDHGLTPLFHALGVTTQPGVIASETQYMARTHTPADRTTVHTSQYSSHPTVTLAARNAPRVASVFIEGVSLGVAPQPSAGVSVHFPITAADKFFRDLDGDYEHDSNETWEQVNFMAAVTVRGNGKGAEGRAVIIGDGDFGTDQVLGNPGNALVLGDSLQWFLGAEQIVGTTTTEEDVRIEHTRDEDKAWFYGTSLGVPLPILGLAFVVATRRRRNRLGAMEEATEYPNGQARSKEAA